MYIHYIMVFKNLDNKKSSRVIGVQFSILSPEEIRTQSVAEITTKETYISGKPVPSGLFDQRMGVLEPGTRCPTDGLDYMETPGYFAHLELARPVFYIQYLSTIMKILKCICFKCSNILLNKTIHSHLLDLSPHERWNAVYKICSGIKRCGEDNENGCGCKKPDKIKKDKFATIIAEWAGLEDTDTNTVVNITPEIFIKIFRRISDEDITFLGFSPIWSRPEWMICQVLAIPPPAVRPSVKHDAQQRSEDDITHIIINIIKYNDGLKEKIKSNADKSLIDDWTTLLQFHVAVMINNKIPGGSPLTQRSGRPLKSISERLNGKTGRVRGNLMGKRVDFSARSVITPDANIGIRQIGVPKKIAMNITYPETVNSSNIRYLTKLVKNGPEKYPGANVLRRKNGDDISLRYVDKNNISIEIGDVVSRHMLDGDPVLFNRQPTLHRMSMMSHRAKIMHVGDSFRMNVADTAPYNADFDGDEMNMHNPQNPESVSELINLASVEHHIISPGNNKPIIGIFQDSLLGSFRFTRDTVKFSNENNDYGITQAMNLLMSNSFIDTSIFKNSMITSHQIISQILPPISTNTSVKIKAGKFIAGYLEKKALGDSSKGIIHSICNDYGNKNAADFIDNLQNIVTEYMKLSSYSVGVSDLLSNVQTNDKINEIIGEKRKQVDDIFNQIQLGIFDNSTGKSNNEEFETKINNISNKAQNEISNVGKNSLSKENKFVIMINAGSKGKPINIAQMISCLGQQNVDGKRIPYGFDNRTLPHYSKFDDSLAARGFVENSFINGLTPQEVFFHAMGGRVGLIDTAVKTSQTGYIQRRLIKGMEDVKVEYDMTVRNNMNKIVQFSYGSDGFSTMAVEKQKLPFVSQTIDDIYDYFTISKSIIPLVFTSDISTRLNASTANTDSKFYIKKITDDRDVVARNVFNMKNTNDVYIPVNFNRIIKNVQDNLKITDNTSVDISPSDAHALILDTFDSFKTKYQTPSLLFELMYFYYISPKNLLVNNRFHRKALELLLNIVETMYKKAIVHPGEMVGMICAQSIGEPATQMTLNTFHFAGVSSKSNVTRGVPRFEELLNITSKPKNPSITVSLKEEDNNIQNAQEIKYNLEMTRLIDIINESSIYFDPKNDLSHIKDDRELLSIYSEYSKLFEEEDDKFSNWVIRLEFNREEMLNRNLTMDDVFFTLNGVYNNTIHCTYSDFNADKLIFRIRMSNLLKGKKPISTKFTLDQSDEIYMLKGVLNNILNNIKLRGIKDISKVILRNEKSEIKKENSNYVSSESWVLDTVGCNLLEILGLDYIDVDNTTSNSITEVHEILGIEAARQTIYNEFLEVIEFDNTYINYHNVNLLCDRMCINKSLVSMFRHGINNDNIGPIAKASFEETPEMFFRAARHGELDNVRGVSANVMLGQEGKFGTNAFSVVLDINKVIEHNNIKDIEEQIDVEDLFEIVDDEHPCSIHNIEIKETIDYVNSGKDANESEMGYTGLVSPDYDMGF
jgi:DNA-directed RNA polymerase II subunit RPB1